jgi:hypothetical protein
MPIRVAVPYKALNIFALFNTGSWVRIPLEACVISVLVLSSVGSGLVTGGSPYQGVLPNDCKIYSFRFILNGNRPEGLIRRKKKKKTTYDHLSSFCIATSDVFLYCL